MKAMNAQAGAMVLVCGLAAPAWAQVSPPPSRIVPWRADSGAVEFQGPAELGPRAVWSTVITVPEASWLRVHFAAAELAGVIEEGTGSYLKITSVDDGAVQYLNGESVEQWALSTAYFNGETVLIELLAHPGMGPNRLVIDSVVAGEPAGARTICGNVDDRQLSTDPRAARHMPTGCSAWMWDDTNRMFGSAGHCTHATGHVMQFNVPLSTGTGGTVAPPPEHQYVVDMTSRQFVSGGTGNDWAYIAVFPNSNTGLTPFQRQGAHYTLGAAAPSSGTHVIRITGYGTVTSPVSPTWNQVQKTHTGPFSSLSGTTLRYAVDTTGGNSGSPVLHENNGGVVVGVHTHGGCTSSGGSNIGTAVQHANWTNARNNPLGLARSGRGTVMPPVYAIGDGVNNFGTVNRTTGNFAKVDVAPPRMEGLAYSGQIEKFYAVSNDTYGVDPGPAGRKLWTIDPDTGEAAYIANISGAAGVINGLGWEPQSNLLYGVIQATGTRVTINPATGVATVDGVANSGTSIGAAEFNPADMMLYGIDDSGSASKLVRFTPATGTVQVVGPLGAGIGDCNGLAITEEGEFFTINAATEQLLRIDPATGAATVVGNTGGFFGASYGMSAVRAAPPALCYANCDGGTEAPFLSVTDFGCFLQRFAAGDSYCNCDGSTTEPVLNVADFACFLHKFAAGCSAP